MSTVIRISVNIQQNREEWEICLHCQFVFSSRHLLNMKYYSRPYFSSTCNEALEHHSSSATLLGSSVWLNNLISSTNCLLQHHLIIQNIVKALCWLIFDFFFFFNYIFPELQCWYAIRNIGSRANYILPVLPVD